MPEDSEFAQVETFGPVAAIEVVDSADEAVARANTTTLRARRRDHHAAIPTMGSRSRSGSRRGSCTSTTSRSHDEPQMPFGGVKDSGWGRFGGAAVVDEFTELRWITVQSGTHRIPF